jgi:proteasome beta subunit
MKVETRSFADLVQWESAALPGTLGGEVHGTTVLALRYDQGAIVLADRRATMGSLIMYERAEKIEVLDPWTVVAISGAYARSLEVCRYLRHAFKYYERLNLQELSTNGKLMEISRALSGNMPMAMQGIGLFLPIAAAYDRKTDSFDVYFFDTAGARFQDADSACAGSGSERIRGVFEYMTRTRGAWSKRPYDEVLEDGLRLLDIAATLDSATGGFRRNLPMVCRLDRDGSTMLTDDELRAVVERIGKE